METNSCLAKYTILGSNYQYRGDPDFIKTILNKIIFHAYIKN